MSWLRDMVGRPLRGGKERRLQGLRLVEEVEPPEPPDEIWLPGQAGSPGSTDPLGWATDFLEPYCVFDWIAQNHTTPRIGPTLTVRGTPPSLTAGMLDYSARYFSRANSYYSSTVIDPSAGQDFIVATCCRGATLSNRPIFSTATVDYVSGITAFILPSYYAFHVGLGVGSNYFFAEQYPSFSWVYMLFVHDYSTRVGRLYANGTLTDAHEQASDPVHPGVGVAVGDTPPGGGLQFWGNILRTQLFAGAGIADLITDDSARRIASSVYRIASPTPYLSAYTRVGAVGVSQGSNLLIAGPDAPIVTTDKGFLANAETTNKCYKNMHLTTGNETIITVSAGLTKSTVFEVALLTYGVGDCGLYAYQVVNSTGSDGWVYYGDTVGSLSVFHASVRARITVGSGVELGLYNPGIWTKIADVSTNYVRSHGSVMAQNASQRWALKIPTGCTVRFVMGTLIAGDRAYPEIPNYAAAAAAVLGASTWDLGKTIGDWQTLTTETTPNGWSGGADGAVVDVLSTPGFAVARLDDSTQQMVLRDGTNQVALAVTETDGIWNNLRWKWKPFTGKLLVCNLDAETSAESPYDKDIPDGPALIAPCRRWLRKITIS